MWVDLVSPGVCGDGNLASVESCFWQKLEINLTTSVFTVIMYFK